MNYVIFYQPESLGNNLLVLSDDRNCTRKVKLKDHVIFYHGDQIIGMNLFNVSGLSHEGMYYLDDKINKIIKENAGFDLLKTHHHNELFKVGKIVKCEDIKNTHLHLCKVEVNDKIYQIVCGAKNAREGLLTVVALPGAILPNGLIITSGKLMNFESNGMLCSKRELNLNDDKFNNEGIIELDEKEWKVNQFFKEVYQNE